MELYEKKRLKIVVAAAMKSYSINVHCFKI